MFVVSLKMSRVKIVAILVIIAIIGVVAAWPRASVQADASVSATAGHQVTGVSTNEQRVAFLQSYGWKLDPTPVEVVEIQIPQTFNEVYTNYNNIQKKQGFDFSTYKGKRCKRWTYRVLNYPGVTDEVRANLYVYDNRVIGGDVSTVALNGFMHGFAAPTDTDNLEAVTPSAANIVSGPADVAISTAMTSGN